ncbi:MAG: aminodeoxychorismate/anthranilate synthase component II [Parachlamydiaceae bacterium]|nr:aminodeoxychorismate/anthranilate synthase component II [Parachlamydiaceae bacterium]
MFSQHNFQIKKIMLLFIDNFDSFTYNLVQCFYQLNAEVKVVREGSLSVDECLSLFPKYIVIGPGPGTPSQAILSKELLSMYAGKIPILGVCLGHQAIIEYYGGNIIRAEKPMHGKISRIKHDDQGIFNNIPQNFQATRYHSLIAEESTLPSCLNVTARSEHGEIMGIRHKQFQIEGVQFHPESILTEFGMRLLENFYKLNDIIKK